MYITNERKTAPVIGKAREPPRRNDKQMREILHGGERIIHCYERLDPFEHRMEVVPPFG